VGARERRSSSGKGGEADEAGKAGEQAEPTHSELFRTVNERIRELAGSWQGTYDFVCECDDQECTRVLRLTESEYESLRGEPGLFAVLPGHERSGDEIAARTERFVLVRPSARLATAR
jgi:hypothetical protein